MKFDTTRPSFGCMRGPISEPGRRPEAQFWREFEIARPLILGALLDAVVHGLRRINHMQLEALPRMADFALWAAACETALWPRGAGRG